MTGNLLSDLVKKSQDNGDTNCPFVFRAGKRMEPGEGKYRLFVYGTLKHGYGNNRLLQVQGAKYINNAKLRGYLMISMGSIPGIVKAPNADWEISGELYEIEEYVLKTCDQLEGVPDFYQRIEVELQEGDGKAFVYVLPRELKQGQRFIPRGIWYPTAPVYLWKEGIMANTSLLDVDHDLPLTSPSTAVTVRGVQTRMQLPKEPNRPISPELQVGPGYIEAAE